MKFLNIKLIVICLLALSVSAQQRLEKASQSIKANKDVVINLNTSHTDIEVDTWNKDHIEIETYIESDELTKEELKKALDAWEVNIDGTTDEITVQSGRSGGLWDLAEYNFDDSSFAALKDLEKQMVGMPVIADMPELLESLEGLKELEELKELESFAVMPEMLEYSNIPKLPELPELPEGISNVHFDYEEYKEGGEKYLEEWSKTYEKKYGKEYKEKMKAWAKEFGKVDFKDYEKKMEAWGKKFGEEFNQKYGKDFESKMEKWGEKFGKEFGEKMEVWSKNFEENFAKKMEDRSLVLEKRAKLMEEKVKARQNKSKERLKRIKLRPKRYDHHLFDSSVNQKIKKTIKIKMPKKAKLKLNVKHGELKMVSIISNSKGNVDYGTLLAKNIDGSDTSINVSYSNVSIDEWKEGELKLNYVEKAVLKNVNELVLNSVSSDVNIDHLGGNTIIDGSFGELVIQEILPSFNNLNIVLENSDAILKLPKTNFNLFFKGNQSLFNNENTSNKTIKNHPNNTNSNKTIVINAKYSSVITE